MIPNFSGSCALTTLSQKVVTNLVIFSTGDMMIKLNKELKTISKSFFKYSRSISRATKKLLELNIVTSF